jgi:hypothetical protein
MTGPPRARISSAEDAFFGDKVPPQLIIIDGKSSSIRAIDPCLSSPDEYASE